MFVNHGIIFLADTINFVDKVIKFTKYIQKIILIFHQPKLRSAPSWEIKPQIGSENKTTTPP